MEGGRVIWYFDGDASNFYRTVSKVNSTISGIQDGLKSAEKSGKQSFDNLSQSASSLSSALKTGSTSVSGFGSAIGSMGRFASETVTSIAKLGVATATTLALFSAQPLLETAGNLEQLQMSFQSVTRSAQAGGKYFSDLYQFAQKSPFPLESLAKTSQYLLSANKTADEAKQILLDMTDVAGAAGANLEGFGYVTSQVFGAGRAYGNDFFQLVNNRATTIFPEIAKILGISMGEVRAAFGDGRVTAEVYGQALRNMAAEGGVAFQGNAKAAQTFNGLMNNMVDNVKRAGLALVGLYVDPNALEKGLQIQPGGIFDRLKKTLNEIIDLTNSKAFADFATSFGNGINKLLGYAESLGTTMLPLGGLVLGAFGPFLSQIPLIGPIFAGLNWQIGLTIGLLGALVASSPELQASLGTALQIIGDAFVAIQPSIEQVVGIFQQMMVDVGPALADVVIALAQSFAQVLTAVAPLLPPLAKLVAELLPLLIPLLQFAAENAEWLIAAWAGYKVFTTANLALSKLSATIDGAKMAMEGFKIGMSGAKVAMEGPERMGGVLGGTLNKLKTAIQRIPGVSSALSGALNILKIAFTGVAAVIRTVVIGALSLIVAHPIIAAIVGIIALLTFLQVKFNIFGKLWEWLKGIFDKVKQAIVDNMDTIKKVLLGIAAILLAPFLPLIGLIVLVVKNFDTIKNAIIDFGKSVINVFKAIWNFIEPVVNFIKNLLIIVIGGAILLMIYYVKFLWAVWSAIFTFIWNTTVTVLTAIWNFIVTVFTAIWNAISTALQWVWDTIVSVWNAIYGFIAPIIQTIVDWVVEKWNWLKDTVVGALTALWDFYVSIWTKIFETVTGIVQKIIDFFAPAISWLFEKGKDIVQGLINGIKSLANAVWDAIKTVAGKIGEFFSGAWNWLYDTGKAIIQGLINGIGDMIGAVNKKVQEIANKVKNGLKDALGIHSPSTVMAGYGRNIGEGLAMGISATESLVASAVQGMSGMAINGIPVSVTAPDGYSSNMLGGGEVSSGVSRTENHIGTINIASEVDGENWLKKLTRDDEITRTGLVSA